jgi:Tol biopolymer transport system component
VRDYTSYGARGGETRLLVRRSSDHTVLMDLLVDGYVGDDVRPSPRGTNQVLMMWGEALLKPRAPVVYDLDTRRLLYVTQPGKTPDALSWLPDGSLLRVQPSGQISKVALGGAEQPVATVRWPEGRVPQALHVSPDGRQALVQLAAWRDTGTVSGVDLWMMAIDGSGLRRYTRNDLVAHAFWSPDGRQVAFVKDTGVACSAATCQGSCTLWHAAATATDVVATAPSGDAQRFPLKRPDGSATAVGCPGIAWTR